MKNEEVIYPIIKTFYDKINNNDFVIDKSGVKMIEIICPVIHLDPKQNILDFVAKKTNEEYCKKELTWYLSQDLSIIGHVDDVKIWNNVCSKDDKKLINSNYGWCIFSKENGFQYENCKNELINNHYSRRAVMIYTRPSMWNDYNKNGMSDFICTDGVQCFIRENKLIYIIKQRSADLIFGLFNDFYWHCFVCNKLSTELNISDCEIIYIPFSLHVYENHFSLLIKMYEALNKN